MRYFEKVFDGQVLKWCVNGAELGGGVQRGDEFCVVDAAVSCLE